MSLTFATCKPRVQPVMIIIINSVLGDIYSAISFPSDYPVSIISIAIGRRAPDLIKRIFFERRYARETRVLNDRFKYVNIVNVRHIN